MPVTRKIEGPSGKEFWSTLSAKEHTLEEYQMVATALKEEFRRPEAAHQIHFSHREPVQLPHNIPSTKVDFKCFRDCLVFLLRGVIFLEGSETLVEPGYAYAIKDEEMLGLGGNTTIFVMEEGAMRGICAQKTREVQEAIRRIQEAYDKRQRRPWNRVRNKFRREKPLEMCVDLWNI
ncbi:hypothetical protein PG991_001507 [Apiospora marii]|uniref:Uncharacterized protein n=1 Tax=Apiospora marii TaxID=335849 RepID=A0ABR1SPV5_9PEZI